MDCCAHEGPASGDACFDVESDDDVVIVDTHSKPSAARVIVDRLREITAKPVRNEVYPAAYPGAEIITNQLTREAMVRKGLKRIQDHVRQVPGEVARLRAELAARRPSRPTSTTARGGPACSPTSSGPTRW